MVEGSFASDTGTTGAPTQGQGKSSKRQAAAGKGEESVGTGETKEKHTRTTEETDKGTGMVPTEEIPPEVKKEEPDAGQEAKEMEEKGMDVLPTIT